MKRTIFLIALLGMLAGKCWAGNLAHAIMYLYPDAVPLDEYIVQDDGAGQYISYWDENAIGNEMPTLNQEQIDTYSDLYDAQTLAVSNCGSGATISGTDGVFTVVVGAGATSCDITFSQAHLGFRCFFTPGIDTITKAQDDTGFTFEDNGMSGKSYDVLCKGQGLSEGPGGQTFADPRPGYDLTPEYNY